jgi:hypothetical protein
MNYSFFKKHLINKIGFVKILNKHLKFFNVLNQIFFSFNNKIIKLIKFIH